MLCSRTLPGATRGEIVNRLSWNNYSFTARQKIFNMKSRIIKLNLAGTIVHVNVDHIIYYYAKQEQNGQIATVIYLEKNWGIEVSETPDEIDARVAEALR